MEFLCHSLCPHLTSLRISPELTLINEKLDQFQAELPAPQGLLSSYLSFVVERHGSFKAPLCCHSHISRGPPEVDAKRIRRARDGTSVRDGGGMGRSGGDSLWPRPRSYTCGRLAGGEGRGGKASGQHSSQKVLARPVGSDEAKSSARGVLHTAGTGLLWAPRVLPFPGDSPGKVCPQCKCSGKPQRKAPGPSVKDASTEGPLEGELGATSMATAYPL